MGTYLRFYCLVLLCNFVKDSKAQLDIKNLQGSSYGVHYNIGAGSVAFTAGGINKNGGEIQIQFTTNVAKIDYTNFRNNPTSTLIRGGRIKQSKSLQLNFINHKVVKERVLVSVGFSLFGEVYSEKNVRYGYLVGGNLLYKDTVKPFMYGLGVGVPFGAQVFINKNITVGLANAITLNVITPVAALNAIRTSDNKGTLYVGFVNPTISTHIFFSRKEKTNKKIE